VYFCLPRAVHPLFIFHAPASSERYTLSLHDALPILKREFMVPLDCDSQCMPPSRVRRRVPLSPTANPAAASLNDAFQRSRDVPLDRKSTRLNSSQSASRMPSSA